MTVIAAIQARMGSTRLPGKVLAELGGLPLLVFMLQRVCKAASLDRVVVATSESPADDAVTDAAAKAGASVVRGSEWDVLGRFVTVAEIFPADHMVRLTADCPLSDPEIIERAVRAHMRAGADYTSNTLVRTFPDGLDVEVVRTECLKEAGRMAEDAEEREHVTPYIYRRPARYKLCSVRSREFLAHHRWTVDTPEDLEYVRMLVDGVSSSCSWSQLVSTSARLTAPPSRLLVPTADSTPGNRRWDLHQDGVALGRVTLDVTDGFGRARAEVGEDNQAAAIGLLKEALKLDCQVSRLSVDAKN